MNRNYSEYFESVTDFFDNNFKLFIIAFLVAVVIEIIIFAIRARKVGFEHDSLYISIMTNILVIIGIFILSCLVVAIYNYFKTLEWNIVSEYIKILDKAQYVFFIVGVIGGGILGWLLAFNKFEWDEGPSILFATLFAFIGLLGLLLIAFIALILIKVLINLFIITFFIFIELFTLGLIIVKENWIYIVLCIGIQCVIFGAYLSLKNYILSFKKNIVD